MRLPGRRRDHTDRRHHEPVSDQERLITAGLASLRSATAREVMTPRIDVVALQAPVTVADVVGAVASSGRSHYPVYRGDLDHVLGVLYLKDLVGSFEELASGGRDLKSVEVTGRLRQPYIVPETRACLETLADMRRRRRGFALVVDEYGGLSGVLTINDLVSELVGDIHDEYDASKSPEIITLGDDRFLVEGATPVSDIRSELGIDVPDGDYVTLGGYLFDAFGRIPDEGDVLEQHGRRFKVAKMDRHRIAKVLIEAHRVP